MANLKGNFILDFPLADIAENTKSLYRSRSTNLNLMLV